MKKKKKRDDLYGNFTNSYTRKILREKSLKLSKLICFTNQGHLSLCEKVNTSTVFDAQTSKFKIFCHIGDPRPQANFLKLFN